MSLEGLEVGISRILTGSEAWNCQLGTDSNYVPKILAPVIERAQRWHSQCSAEIFSIKTILSLNSVHSILRLEKILDPFVVQEGMLLD